jgi:hypothetical protein
MTFQSVLFYFLQTLELQKNGIEETLFGFASNNRKKIALVCNKLRYPPMKILDMYFWQLGYNFEEKNRKK